MPNTYAVDCACCGNTGVVSGTGCSCDPMPRRIFLVITFTGTAAADCPGLTLTGHVDYNAALSTVASVWTGSVTDGTQTVNLEIDCAGSEYRICFGGLSGGGTCLGAAITCGANSYTFPNAFFTDGVAHVCVPLDLTYSDPSDPSGGKTLQAVVSATG